jgi:hypothetical protein
VAKISRDEQQVVNTRASTIAHVDWLVEAARAAERARCVKLLLGQAGAFHEDDVERAIFCQAARLIKAPT